MKLSQWFNYFDLKSLVAFDFGRCTNILILAIASIISSSYYYQKWSHTSASLADCFHIVSSMPTPKHTIDDEGGSSTAGISLPRWCWYAAITVFSQCYFIALHRSLLSAQHSRNISHYRRKEICFDAMKESDNALSQLFYANILYARQRKCLGRHRYWSMMHCIGEAASPASLNLS